MEDLVDILYNFIVERFTKYYWKSANKYNYSTTNIAYFKSYNDFLLTQEITLYNKTYDELILLIEIKKTIESNKLSIMNTKHMYPDKAYGFLFDTDGSLVIFDKK